MVTRSAVFRLELRDVQSPAHVSIREDEEGAVGYVKLNFADMQLALCIRHPRHARRLQDALERVVEQLNEVAAFTE
jgi:hypothetical protein